jgi:glycosyltransferase involved in cell wall biosynthesis
MSTACEHQIIHVVESFSAGTLSTVHLLALIQSELEIDVSIVFLRREETPNLDTLEQMFGPGVSLACLGKSNVLGKIKLLLWLTSKVFTRSKKSIFHCHSSWAGLITRTTIGFNRRKTLFYTPHGFSFIRTDLSFLAKNIYKFTELVLARYFTTNIVSTSEHEHLLAQHLSKGKSVLLRNAVDIEDLRCIRESTNRELRRQLEVCTSGRIAVQKNPMRFQEVASLLKEDHKFTWIGGGDLSVLNSKKIDFEVSGWLSRNAALEKLATSDIFLLLSDWESFPFSLLEAQAMGIPSIVWNFDTARELVENGTTGFVCESISEVIRAINLLSKDRAMYTEISSNSKIKAQQSYSIALFREKQKEIYKCKECRIS